MPCSTNQKASVLDAFDAVRDRWADKAESPVERKALEALARIRAEAEEEIAFYERLLERCCDKSPQTFRRNALTSFRLLLPVWIVRQEFCRLVAPNLYGLGLWDCGGADRADLAWNDASPLGSLLNDLARCLSFDADDDAVADYRTCVMGEYEEYRDAYCTREADTEKEQLALSVPRLFELFQENEGNIPPWVRHKANLIWNLYVCPLFGVAHRLPTESSDGTATASDLVPFDWKSEKLGVGSGQVPIVQLKSKVCDESKEERALDLGSSSNARGLVMLFGSRYDRSYWNPLREAIETAVEGFFSGDGFALRAFLQETGRDFFSNRRLADIRQMLRQASKPLSKSEQEALVASLPSLLLAALEKHLQAYCEAHPRTLVKSGGDAENADSYPTVSAAVDAARRAFVANLPKSVKIAGDLERTLATALAQFFEAELGATEQEGAQGVGKEESLVYSLVFDRIEEFFADDPASPCKQLLCQNMESSLLDWRGKSRKAIDCNALLAAVDRAFDACIDEEQRLFCATGPGNVPGPKTGAINSRRHFALVVEGGKLLMRDLRSQNGSFVIRANERQGSGANAAGATARTGARAGQDTSGSPDAAGTTAQTGADEDAERFGTVYVFEGKKQAPNALEAARKLGYACLAIDGCLQAQRGDVLVIGRYSRFQIG